MAATMTFAEPLRLLLLIIPAAFIFLVWRSLTRRSKAAVRFSQTELLADLVPQRSWRRILPPVLLVLATILFALALAHPQIEIEIARETRQLVLAFDVSFSMEAEDVPPSRIEVAKQAAKDFIEAAPDDIEIGLVKFAGTIVGVELPTKDKAKLLGALDNITLEPGTAIGDAIVTSLGILTEGEGPNGSIVVLSDGESTVGTTDSEAVAKAIEQEVPISTISFGTSDGFIIQDGEKVPVASTADSLIAIAEMTGGASAQADNPDTLYETFDAIQASVAPERVTYDLGDIILGLAFLLLSVGFVLSLWWFSRLA